MRILCAVLLGLAALLPRVSQAEAVPRVVDIPTRPGVTQRILYLPNPAAKAALILVAGGHGALNISDSGSFGWGGGNFLVRTRNDFVEQGLAVAVIDKPSDRDNLSGFRQTSEHVADLQAVIAWMRKETGTPVWLAGTSRGTQSVAYVATMLADAASGPDGIVLTSTILTDKTSLAVPRLPLEKITRPVLVVHHESDGCPLCNYHDVPQLMDKLTSASRKELISARGGVSKGSPCEAMAYHGYNGIEKDVVKKIAAWILAK